MDKSRWMLSYLLGFWVGAFTVNRPLHLFSYWVLIIGGPVAAMLIDEYRSKRQREKY